MDSDNIESESPDPRFGLGHLLPSRVGLLPELTPTRPPTPASDRSSEYNAGSSHPFEVTRSAILHRMGSESPLKGRENRSNLFSALLSAIPSSEQVDQSARRHHPSDSSLTIKQEDFWSNGHPGTQLPTMYQSRYANLVPAKPEKELPELPKESPASKLQKPSLSDLASPTLPTMERKDSNTSIASLLRRKKIVLHKGKKFIVNIPIDAQRGGRDNAPVPLTPAEVAARLDSFAKLGYDVRGFGFWKSADENFDCEHLSQNRVIHPDPAEQIEAHKRKFYHVRLPDTREWDLMLKSNVEAALRELGVSGPDGEEEVENPMSRQTSSHVSSNPFSPPVRATSAGSQPFAQIGSFPPSFAAASAPTSHAASIASPVSSMANVRPTVHMHRQSTFSPPVAAQMVPPPGLSGWSPQPLVNPQPMSSIGSPPLSNSRPELLNRQSPAVPSQSQPAQQFSYAQRDELVAQMHRQQHQQLQMQLQRQQEQQLLAARPPSTLNKVPEVEDEGDLPQPEPTLLRGGETPEVIHPKPVHRHNYSAQLEKDAEKADYHLEASITKQLDDEDAAEDHDRSDVALGSSKSELSHRISSLQKQMETSDVETNPSDLDNLQRFANANGSHKSALNHFSSSWADDVASNDGQRPRHGQQHASKKSVSVLNVDAKEFNPRGGMAFNPGVFAGSSFSFQPQPHTKPFVPRSFGAINHSTPSSVTSPGNSSFNPAAAAFSPTGFGGFNISTAPKEFSFNAQGPVFKPTAPIFTPSSSCFSDKSIGSSVNSGSIFGNINFSDIVKPSKKSKAVAIVAPKQVSPVSQEDKEDDDGRIVQDDARFKRARRRDSTGDQVPQFAEPYYGTEVSGEIAPHAEPVRQDTMSTQIDESAASDISEEVSQDISFLTNSTVEVAEPAESEPQATAGALNHAFVFERPDKPDSGALPTQSEEARVSPLGEQDGKVSEMSPSKKRPHQRALSALAPSFQPRTRAEIKPDLSPHSVGTYGIKETQTVEPVVSQRSSRRSSRTDVEPIVDDLAHDEGLVQATTPSRRVPSSVRYYDEQDEDQYQPTFEEIDTVMKHFDEEGSDAGVVREVPSWPASSPGDHTSLTPGRLAEYQRSLEARLRSDAPSPSPRHVYAPPVGPEGDSDPFSDARAAASPVIADEDAGPERPISDWDDALSSGRTQHFEDRSSFFDRHVQSLIDKAVQGRLSPLEKQLQQIHSSLVGLTRNSSRHRPRSQPTVESDADDEDEGAEADVIARGWSPRRDRKFDKFRTIVQDALATQRQSTLDVHDLHDALDGIKTTLTAVSSLNADDIRHAVATIKVSVDESVSQALQLDDIRTIVEESVARQNAALIESREQAKRGEDPVRSSEFADALKLTTARLAEETEARKIADDRREEAEHLLKLTEQELAMFKESSRDVGQAASGIAEQVNRAEMRAEEAEAKAEQLKNDLARIATENAALTATLEEYRLSHDKWRKDIDKAYQDRESVMQTFTALRLQAEEAIRLRESMRTKIEKLHSDLSDAAAQLAAERAQWQKKQVEHLTQYEVLAARAEAEARTRERFEREMERLEVQEREAMRLRATLEQAHKGNARLEENVNSLKLESAEHQKTAEQYAREFREAREAGRIEVERTRRLLEADIEAANNEVNIVRAELEAEVARVRSELDHVKIEADTTKAKHELDLEQAADAQRDAVQELANSKNAALEEQRIVFEERMEELRKQHRRDLDHVIENKNQAETFLREAHAQKMEDLQEQHQRALEQTLEDKRRSETYLNDRLGLADEKIAHLQDKVLHLEEKLEVAKAAANAAALAARSGKTPASEGTPSPVATRGPEKLNPQALRETIAVLQDQLQERESRIETLEQELSELDKDAPNKLKAKDTEIGWLRELLGVRLDDLSDLVNALLHPDFDREAVRNAAIRIRTGLQMEQHDKERQMSGSPVGNFPSLASISNFASPKAAQLAAAWGSWRKGRELIPSGLSQSAQSLASSTNNSRDITPSKPPTSAAAQSFFSGLMTPPASNLRPSPEPESSSKTAANGSLARSLNNELSLSKRAQEKMAMPIPMPREPTTPPLLRKASYDSDANAVVDDGEYSTAGYYDDESTVDDGTPRIGAARRGSSMSFASTGSMHSTPRRERKRGSFGPTMI